MLLTLEQGYFISQVRDNSSLLCLYELLDNGRQRKRDVATDTKIKWQDNTQLCSGWQGCLDVIYGHVHLILRKQAGLVCSNSSAARWRGLLLDSRRPVQEATRFTALPLHVICIFWTHFGILLQVL